MEESLKEDFQKKICILCENKECNCKNILQGAAINK